MSTYIDGFALLRRPGIAAYRGAFYNSRSAGQFALTQAAALSDTREVDSVSVAIDAVYQGSSRRDVEVLGTPGELAAELTALPAYKNGVLRTVISAPREVTTAVTAVLDASPALPDSEVDAPMCSTFRCTPPVRPRS
ncbi:MULTISPECIES: hypothetical protein [unclassified Rhodococcus (in: high G+C Gram-positive bacteria)]|uniref:hypothetical protein n=1 Tax=unclassified Rhodococcus (in: high G+C Gram-positive bacteria) TaxID=192944 RepID=UPI00339859F7